MKCGDIVAYDENGEIVVYRNGYDIPIGVAAHDIEEGEIIEYDPTKNTKDIIIFASIREAYQCP